VLVNDGSSDRTLDALLAWANADVNAKVLHLSRNFGHQIASTAGLDHASGDAIVLIDADLQDPLSAIHGMIAQYCQGYDVVYGRREKRSGESPFKLATAWVFYRIMQLLVYSDLPVDTGDFRLISRHCLAGLQSMRETHRFLRGMVAWAGYPQIAFMYDRGPRLRGQTKYPLRKMLTFAWTAATSFSTLPLKLSWMFGCLVGLFGIEEGFRAVMALIMGWYVVPGWTSLMVVGSLVGAVLLMSLGVLGQYVGIIYEQAKGRPLYLVSRKFNCN
jgi:glycosyltransferase involved in cell wall biosynthesis